MKRTPAKFYVVTVETQKNLSCFLIRVSSHKAKNIFIYLKLVEKINLNLPKADVNAIGCCKKNKVFNKLYYS